MVAHFCIFIHVFNGEQRVISAEGPDTLPRELGMNLASFLRALSDHQIDRMIRMLDNMDWVDDHASAPEHIQQRYQAFGLYQASDCFGAHTPGQHSWACMSPMFHVTSSLPYILDGVLGHMIDDTFLYDEGELDFDWEYRVDWDARTLHVSGPMPGEMRVAFEKVNAQWMKGCLAANRDFG